MLQLYVFYYSTFRDYDIVRKRDRPLGQRAEGIRLEGGDYHVKEISRVYRRVLRRVCTFREVVNAA